MSTSRVTQNHHHSMHHSADLCRHETVQTTHHRILLSSYGSLTPRCLLTMDKTCASSVVRWPLRSHGNSYSAMPLKYSVDKRHGTCIPHQAVSTLRRMPTLPCRHTSLQSRVSLHGALPNPVDTDPPSTHSCYNRSRRRRACELACPPIVFFVNGDPAWCVPTAT